MARPWGPDGVERAVGAGRGLREPDLLLGRLHAALGDVVRVVEADRHDLAGAADRGEEPDRVQGERPVHQGRLSRGPRLDLGPGGDQADHLCRQAGRRRVQRDIRSPVTTPSCGPVPLSKVASFIYSFSGQAIVGGAGGPHLDAEEILQGGPEHPRRRRRRTGRRRSSARGCGPRDRASSRRPGFPRMWRPTPHSACRPASFSRWWPSIRSSRSATSKAAWLKPGPLGLCARNKVWWSVGVAPVAAQEGAECEAPCGETWICPKLWKPKRSLDHAPRRGSRKR